MSKKMSPKAKKVTFSIKVSKADNVALAGNFNNWDHSTTPLRKVRNDMWQRELDLKPGKYEYKFVVDGKWVTDPNNSNKISNPLGTENSIVEIS